MKGEESARIPSLDGRGKEPLRPVAVQRANTGHMCEMVRLKEMRVKGWNDLVALRRRSLILGDKPVMRMRRGSADSIGASRGKILRKQAGYRTATCLPSTPNRPSQTGRRPYRCHDVIFHMAGWIVRACERRKGAISRSARSGRQQAFGRLRSGSRTGALGFRPGSCSRAASDRGCGRGRCIRARTHGCATKRSRWCTPCA